MSSRRSFLRQSAAAAGAALTPALATLPGSALLGCDDGPSLPRDLPTYEDSAASAGTGPAGLFAHGVASGDPGADSVRLWTRVSPEASPGTSPSEVPVYYEVALDPALEQRVAAGTVMAAESRDYCVHVELGELRWGRTYYYRFRSQGRASVVGRTRLAPEGDVPALRFGVVACSNLAQGWFHAYAHLAQRDDLDAVLHMGDFLYESPSGTLPRAHEPPGELVTLSDYRTRHAQYRREVELQELLRQNPIVAVWDDHETSNNAYATGSPGHNEATEGSWATRKAAAQQAYYEWLPVRRSEDGPLHRTLRYGPLLDLVMLDTRLEGRDPQLADLSLDTPERSLLGAAQEAWLDQQLRESSARWVVLGQQVMVGQLDLPVENNDQWDGYASARERLLDSIEQHAPGRTVVLTGDIHSSWANMLARAPFAPNFDPTRDALAVEFVAPGVTSPFPLPPTIGAALARSLPDSHPHVAWANLSQRGFFTLEITRASVAADWYVLDGVAEDQGELSFAMGADVAHGQSVIALREVPLAVRRGVPPAP
ncbi:MAG: alkaline phosphatase D family protein [Polyangiales bacterium]